MQQKKSFMNRTIQTNVHVFEAPGKEFFGTMHNAYLWIGNQETLSQHSIHALQKILCIKNGCGVCNTCKQIIARQHPSFLWLTPEKNYYTREQLEIIFHTTSFVLMPSEHFFFIIEKADFLSVACANSLLKILEEPPKGYHFILLAERLDSILPTIQSRCIIHYFHETMQEKNHELLAYFENMNTSSLVSFMKYMENFSLTDRQSRELFDQLCHQILNEKSPQLTFLINKTLKKLPMPGSSKLFWKDLYLDLILINKC